MNIVKLALSVSLIGLLGLILYAENVPPVKFAPDVDRELVFEGRLKSFRKHNTTTFLTLSYPAELEAIVFARAEKLQINQSLRLVGIMNKHTLQVYRIEILKP